MRPHCQLADLFQNWYRCDLRPGELLRQATRESEYMFHPLSHLKKLTVIVISAGATFEEPSGFNGYDFPGVRVL
jgi:hypothetical protein